MSIVHLGGRVSKEGQLICGYNVKSISGLGNGKYYISFQQPVNVACVNISTAGQGYAWYSQLTSVGVMININNGICPMDCEFTFHIITL